jgi:hypothetical protein
MQRANEQVWPATWAMVLGSVVIAIHLLLAFFMTLNVPSGPWPTPQGGSTAEAPPFAMVIGRRLAMPYQSVTKSNSTFRFSSIRQEQLDISFEAKLKDDKGTVTSKINFPDPEAPSSIQYRQKLLAQQLGNDEPLPPQQGVILPAAGQQLPTLRWWQQDGDRRYVLKQDNPNAVPRNQQFMQPSVSQMIVAKSFSRFLARHHATAKVEINRIWYDPIMPMVLITDPPPTSDDLRRYSSSYGELNQ